VQAPAASIILRDQHLDGG